MDKLIEIIDEYLLDNIDILKNKCTQIDNKYYKDDNLVFEVINDVNKITEFGYNLYLKQLTRVLILKSLKKIIIVLKYYKNDNVIKTDYLFSYVKNREDVLNVIKKHKENINYNFNYTDFDIIEIKSTEEYNDFITKNNMLGKVITNYILKDYNIELNEL